MSNLPPGVTESMIPGNRPEDIEYEKFWEDITNKAVEFGLEDYWVDDLKQEHINLIDWIAGEAYQKGYHQGLADSDMDRYYRNDDYPNNKGGDNIPE